MCLSLSNVYPSIGSVCLQTPPLSAAGEAAQQWKDWFPCLQLSRAPLVSLPPAWRVSLQGHHPQGMVGPQQGFPCWAPSPVSSCPLHLSPQSPLLPPAAALQKFQLAPVEIPVLLINSLLDRST